MGKKEVMDELSSYSQSHISLLITNSSMDKQWIILIGFYGQPIATRRLESSHLLRLLKPSNQLPWLCVRF